MSWDLTVVTETKIALDPIRRAAQARGYTLQGSSLVRDTASGGCVVNTEEPARLEAEDIAENWTGCELNSGWMYPITVEGSATDRDLACARGIARSLVDAGGGFVYDPQRGEVIWPRALSRRIRAAVEPDPGPDEEREWGFDLQWTCHPKLSGRDIAERFLRVFCPLVPSATPRRFGERDPYPYSLQRDGEARFLAECGSRDGRGPTWIFWSTSARDQLGSIQFPDPRPRWTRGGRDLHLWCPQLSIHLSGEPTDAAWWAPLSDAFVRLATALDALCAGVGCVDRSSRLDDRYDVPSAWPLRVSRSMGWLYWFGRPYVAALESNPAFVSAGSGRLLRLAERPVGIDESRVLAPRFGPDVEKALFEVPLDPMPLLTPLG